MLISASAKDLIAFIRLEKQRRSSALSDHAEDDVGDQWFTCDLPFINDLALMAIVAIRHDFERQLVRLAARVTGDERPISHGVYLKNVQCERDRVRKWNLLILEDKLPGLSAIPEWSGPMKLLQWLANCYKHDPWVQPDECLIKLLDLHKEDSYLTLPENDEVRKAVAKRMGLPTIADYCDIAESMIQCANLFLEKVSKNAVLAKVQQAKPRLRFEK